GELPGNRGVIAQRPFRAPHHTISAAALAGGGAKPKPGEISLAHGGVLFLDEIPEFGRRSLEVLRQPLEEKQITISRTSGTAAFPSDFLLIAACNPCPCGFYGDGTERCQCSAGQIHSYMAKLSGPLMDRIDMHIELSRIGWEELNPACETEDMSLDSKTLREAVCAARELQKRRYRDTGISCNAQLQQNAVNRYCQITAEAGTLMRNAFARLPLSARSCKKILLLARTIADLEESEKIQAEQIAEAIQYRNLDRIRF
ncbi:MAG: ATP-binding protein, partial [Anaerovoracaceae bacterium]|nr:ATP-binding protein [Anaerovoracaceae bacterium]